MASVLKVDRIETPSGTGNISLAQPISGDGSQLTGITAGTPADDSVTGAKIDLSLVAGDIMYASGVDTLERLPKGTDGELLTLASGVPSWAANTVPDDSVTGGKIDLSLVAGDIIYSDATDSIERLAKGTDGEVLTLASGVPSWAAAGGAGTAGWNKLDEEVVTGTPTDVRFEQYIDATYRNYAVVWNDVHPSVNMTTFRMRYGTGGTYLTTGYNWDYVYSIGASVATQNGGVNGNGIRISNDVGADRSNNVEEGTTGIVYIFNMFDATKVTKAIWQCFAMDGTSTLFNIPGGSSTLKNNTAFQEGNITSYNNLLFEPGSGTLAGGRFKLYGLAD